MNAVAARDLHRRLARDIREIPEDVLARRESRVAIELQMECQHARYHWGDLFIQLLAIREAHRGDARTEARVRELLGNLRAYVWGDALAAEYGTATVLDDGPVIDAGEFLRRRGFYQASPDDPDAALRRARAL